MAEHDWWYEKYKKDVAAALKKAKGAAKEDGVPCTLVKMKDGSGVLCAHVSASKAAAQVKEAKSVGGKVLSAGALYNDGGLTFAVSVGSTSVKALFSTAAAGAAGAPLNVTVIAVGPAAEAAAAAPAAPPAAPPSPPPAPDMGAVRAALSKLIPVVQAAAKAHPERKGDLLAPLARCQQQIKDNRAAEARATLVEVGRLVKALAPAADGQGAPKKAPEADGQGAPKKAPETAAEQDAFKEQYNGLLETIPGDLRRLRAVDAAVADKVQKVVDGAAAHAGRGNFQKAFAYLNQAAEVMAKAAGAGRAKEAAEVIPEGKVEAMKAALSRAQAQWGAAVTAARARLKPVQAALKADFPNAAVGVQNIVDSYEQDLLEDLRAGQAKADEDGLAAAIRDTLARVQSLRAEAAGDKVFSYLEQCGVPVKAAFGEAFDEVESLLQV